MRHHFYIAAIIASTLNLTLAVNTEAAVEKLHKAKPKIKKIQSTTPLLTESERSSLRFRLENIWNEVDLLVRNAATDKKDVQKQEREFKTLQVYQKIPVASGDSKKAPVLTEDIKKSGQRFGLKISNVQILQSSEPDRPVPNTLPTDARSFHFTEDQLVQKLRMDIVLSGTKLQLQDWMNSWNVVAEPGSSNTSSPTPFLEWDPNALTTLPELLSGSNGSVSNWKVHVQAYRFRDIRFPKLQPQDPLALLPDWARQDPERFKAQEPLLWGLVERTRATLPQALPGYDVRGQFALNSARMAFFTSKVTHFE